VKTLPLSEVKEQLSKIVDAVAARDEQVVITRNGRPAAMLVSPHEFEGWQATIEIMRDPEFMEDIHRGLRELDEGRVLSQREIEELFGLRPGEAGPVIGPKRKRVGRATSRRGKTPR
jgi:prevent-host-death family protein